MAAATQPVLIMAVAELTAAGMAVVQACRLVGIARSSYYRLSRGYRHYRPVTDPVPHRDRDQPAALSDAERAVVVEVLEDEQYCDLSVVQTYWRAFDAARLSCSQATFCRIARAERLTGDRRRTRRGGPKRPVPTAVASRPNQLWSWDATELSGGPDGRERYQLMLVLDVYSRYPIGWSIEHAVTGRAATALFTAAFVRHGTADTVHADNGSAMRSTALAGVFAAHQVTGSFSRPRVSNDNPFSESMFKTIKYDLDCPARFDSIDHARAWTAAFLDRYAHEHCHSGIGFYTPAAVYHGTVINDQTRRQAQLDTYHAAHPERFRRPPTAPTISPAWINQPRTPELSQTG